MTTATSTSQSEAMRYCRTITRRRARNFYYGLKLLPEPKRSALYALYAWMRRADDLVDGAVDAGAAEGRPRIDAFWRATEAALRGDPTGSDPVLVALRETADRFPLDREQFESMLAGQLEDLEGRDYETFDELRAYCERVASTVGRLCIGIWGYDDDRAPALATERGIAFQLTNILRDFIEDDDRGRVYLPLEEFRACGITPEGLRSLEDPDRCRRFLLEQLERAQSYYEASAPLESMITVDCRPTLWAMTAIYHGLLERMRNDPLQVVRGPRIRLGAMTKGAIALRAKWHARSSRGDGTRNGT